MLVHIDFRVTTPDTERGWQSKLNVGKYRPHAKLV